MKNRADYSKYKCPYSHIEKDGRRYTLQAMYGKGSGPARKFGNKIIMPPPSSHWRWTQERINKAMKDGVIIVNASRGGVVDEAALLNSLESGKVRAAAIDVYEKEPPEDFSLIDHPNVMATPHIGAAADEGQKRAGFEVVQIIRENMSGR